MLVNCLASFITGYPVKERRGAFKWAGEGKVEENGLLEENADGKFIVLVQANEGNGAWVSYEQRNCEVKADWN